MVDYANSLFALGTFEPHRFHFYENPELMWFIIIGNALIALAYILIPAVLLYLVRKRRDLAFHWLFILFGAFIFSCALTHIMHIVIFFYPLYRLQGLIDFATGIISLSTGLAMIPIIPKVLKIPNPTQVAMLNQQLSAANRELERLNKEEANRLAAIVEYSDDAIFRKSVTGIVQSWNKGAEKIYGYSAEEMIGAHISKVVPPHKKAELRKIMKQLRAGQSVDHFETERCCKDGRLVTMSLTISPIRNAAGTIIALSTVARNITEQKQAEIKAKRLIDSNIIGVTILDFDGQFLEANDEFLRMVGYSRSELIKGRVRWDKMTPPEYANADKLALKQLQKTGKTTPREKDFFRKDGSRIPVVIGVAKLDKTTGIGFFLDNTDRKESEQRKDAFISMASHELRTPVTSIKGFVQVLQAKARQQGDRTYETYLAKVNQQLDRLASLIYDLLDISRTSRGELALHKTVFPLHELVTQTIENFPVKDHPVKVQSLPEAQVFADRDRIEQVILNLLTNAVKYSPEGSSIVVSSRVTRRSAQVSVTDAGIGISQEHQTKIFERFYRVFNEKDRTFPGLGVGLYIAAEIMRRHKGKIWVESKEGKGSTFSFSLPTVQPTAE